MQLLVFCGWHLRKQGRTVAQATGQVRGLRTNAKHGLLFEHGINFNDLPLRQKRGLGVYQEIYEKEGFEPKRQQTILT